MIDSRTVPARVHATDKPEYAGPTSALPAPDGDDAFDAQLLQVLREVSGVHDLSFDEAHHVWLCYGEIVVRVRRVDDPPRVQLHAPILRAARIDAALLERLNELNGELGGLRWFAFERTVVAAGETAAAPFVPEHVAQTLHAFCRHAEVRGKALQAEFDVAAFPEARARPAVLH